MEGRIIPGNSSEISCRLPVFFPPPVKIYLHHSIPVSIILSATDSLEWFYANFLQLCDNIKNNPPFPSEYFQFFPNNFSFENSFFLDVRWGHHEDSGSVIDLIRESVRNGFYLDFDMIEYWIPGTAGYLKYDFFTHQCLIFGFDDEKKELNTLNFNPNQDFSILNIGYADFINAHRKTMIYLKESKQYIRGTYSLRMCKLNERKYNLDIIQLKNLLKEYLYAIDSSKNLFYSIYFNHKEDVNWGLNVTTGLLDYIKGINKQQIDFRAMHGLFEHKMIMVDRLIFLKEKNLIKITESNIDDYKGLVKLADKARMHTLLYNQTYKKDFIESISLKLKDLYTQEKRILEDIICCCD